MLKVLGNSFVIQHFLQELKRRRRAEALVTYITDALYCIKNDQRMVKRFDDLYPLHDRPSDDRSAEEIINHVLRALNGGE